MGKRNFSHIRIVFIRRIGRSLLFTVSMQRRGRVVGFCAVEWYRS
jgi:hypothetical protein